MVEYEHPPVFPSGGTLPGDTVLPGGLRRRVPRNLTVACQHGQHLVFGVLHFDTSVAYRDNVFPHAGIGFHVERRTPHGGLRLASIDDKGLRGVFRHLEKRFARKTNFTALVVECPVVIGELAAPVQVDPTTVGQRKFLHFLQGRQLHKLRRALQRTEADYRTDADKQQKCGDGAVTVEPRNRTDFPDGGGLSAIVRNRCGINPAKDSPSGILGFRFFTGACPFVGDRHFV